MRYIYDHDFHIHSKLSSCSRDEGQTSERILQYAKQNNLKSVCLTDHFWDDAIDGASSWYKAQNFEHISQARPLPQAEGIEFLFGCETEMDKFFRLGISKECIDKLDFVVVPTTHLHMDDFTIALEDFHSYKRRAYLWVKRLDTLLGMDLPFYKIGLAHITCSLIAPTREEYLEVLKLIPQKEMERLFKEAAKVGIGIELNAHVFNFSAEDKNVALLPYQIAKEYGCKFYCGSDAHHPQDFDITKPMLEKAIDLLELTEDDKFHVKK